MRNLSFSNLKFSDKLILFISFVFQIGIFASISSAQESDFGRNSPSGIIAANLYQGAKELRNSVKENPHGAIENGQGILLKLRTRLNDLYKSDMDPFLVESLKPNEVFDSRLFNWGVLPQELRPELKLLYSEILTNINNFYKSKLGPVESVFYLKSLYNIVDLMEKSLKDEMFQSAGTSDLSLDSSDIQMADEKYLEALRDQHKILENLASHETILGLTNPALKQNLLIALTRVSEILEPVSGIGACSSLFVK